MKSNDALVSLLVFAAGAFAQQPEKLEYAVVVTRHGVRSPTWTAERLNGYSTAPWPDFGVAPGELTPHGRELMKLMGAYYRSYFAQQGLSGFSGPVDCAAAWFHADVAQRTMVTAQALAETLLPGCSTEIHSAGKDATSDPLFEGFGTPDAALSTAVVAARLGSKPQAIADAHRQALDLLAGILNGSGKAQHSIFEDPVSLSGGKSGVSMSGPLSLSSTFTENFFLEYAEGMTGEHLGWGRVNPSNLLELMSLHTSYAELMRRTPYLARTRGSNLLSYVVQLLEKATAGESKNPLAVISGHDTNISNLSGMLGLSWLLPGYQPDDVPPGGALIFSLWKSADGKRFLRLRFIGQTPEQMHNATPLTTANPPASSDVFIPGCSAAAKGYPCEWKAFSALARTVILPEFTPK